MFLRKQARKLGFFINHSIVNPPATANNMLAVEKELRAGVGKSGGGDDASLGLTGGLKIR